MFNPPPPFFEKPEAKDYKDILKSQNNPNVKKYTEKYHKNANLGLDVKEVPFEESAMGKLQKELSAQTEEFRNYAAQQEINRDLDKKQAKKDAPKKFLRDCAIAIISGIIGSIITTIYNNSGFSIVDFFKNIFH